MSIDKRGNIYLAGPFFNSEQLGAMERVEKLLDKLKLPYYSPRKHLILKPKASWDERKAVFNENIDAIAESKLMLACTEWPDTGTNWEMGFAFALRIPVVGFTHKADKINVMLAQSCAGFLTSEDSLEKFLTGRALGYADIEAYGSWYDYDWEEAKQWLKNIF